MNLEGCKNKVVSILTTALATMSSIPNVQAREVDSSWGIGALAELKEMENTKLFFDVSYRYRYVFLPGAKAVGERQDWHILQYGLVMEWREKFKAGIYLQLFNDDNFFRQLGVGYMISVNLIGRLDIGSSGSYSAAHKYISGDVGFGLKEGLEIETVAEMEAHQEENLKLFLGLGLALQISKYFGLRIEAAMSPDKERDIHTMVMISIGLENDCHVH